MIVMVSLVTVSFVSAMVLVMMPVLMIMMMFLLLMMMFMIMPVLLVFMSEEILHVMVVILFFKNHVEVAGINAGLLHGRDLGPEAIQRKRGEYLLKYLTVRAQIQKRAYRHIAADSRITLKI